MPQDAQPHAIGIDVGATRTRVAVVDELGRVSAVRSASTAPLGGTFDALSARLAEMMSNVRAEVGLSDEVAAPVGLALPGTLDRARRAVVRSIHLPFLEGRAVGEELARRVGSAAGRLALFTDAEAATWGEYIRWSSAGRTGSRASARAKARLPARQAGGSGTFVHLRLGTGVACGVVIGGELQRLDAERDTHLDVLVVDDRPDGARCACGRRGCLETIASGTALAKRARELSRRPTVRDIGPDSGAPAGGVSPVARATTDRPCRTEQDRTASIEGIASLQTGWERGDDAARHGVREASDAVSVALGNLTRRFHPGVICIGGGVTTHLPALLQEVLHHRSLLTRTGDGPCCAPIEAARLGDRAGVIGAALLSRFAVL